MWSIRLGLSDIIVLCLLSVSEQQSNRELKMLMVTSKRIRSRICIVREIVTRLVWEDFHSAQDVPINILYSFDYKCAISIALHGQHPCAFVWDWTFLIARPIAPRTLMVVLLFGRFLSQFVFISNRNGLGEMWMFSNNN